MMNNTRIDVLALLIRSTVEAECQGFTVGFKESMVIAARILSGQQGGAVPASPDTRPEAVAVTEAFPSLGFPRGSIVRLFGQGPNMLVIRSGLGTAAGRTVCVLCEGDAPGGARLKDFATEELEIVLGDAGRLDAEFDLRWKADMRAIERWRSEAPGRDLTMPDHADLVVWLLQQWEAAQVRARLAEQPAPAAVAIQAFAKSMANWTDADVCMSDRDQHEWQHALDEVRAEMDPLWDAVEAYMRHTGPTERNARRVVLMRTSKLARMALAIAELCGWPEGAASDPKGAR